MGSGSEGKNEGCDVWGCWGNDGEVLDVHGRGLAVWRRCSVPCVQNGANSKAKRKGTLQIASVTRRALTGIGQDVIGHAENSSYCMSHEEPAPGEESRSFSPFFSEGCDQWGYQIRPSGSANEGRPIDFYVVHLLE